MDKVNGNCVEGSAEEPASTSDIAEEMMRRMDASAAEAARVRDALTDDEATTILQGEYHHQSVNAMQAGMCLGELYKAQKLTDGSQKSVDFLMDFLSRNALLRPLNQDWLVAVLEHLPCNCLFATIPALIEDLREARSSQLKMSQSTLGSSCYSRDIGANVRGPLPPINAHFIDPLAYPLCKLNAVLTILHLPLIAIGDIPIIVESGCGYFNIEPELMPDVEDGEEDDDLAYEFYCDDDRVYSPSAIETYGDLGKNADEIWDSCTPEDED